MTLRVALSILSLALLAGCVSGGSSDALASREGRAQATQAYVQLGLGYLQQGLTEQAKGPLKKARQGFPRRAFISPCCLATTHAIPFREQHV